MSFKSPLNEPKKPAYAAVIKRTAPQLDALAQFLLLQGAFDDFACHEDKIFRRKDDSKTCFAISSAFVNCGLFGSYTVFAIDQFTVCYRYDETSKRQIETRIRETKTAPSGEPIYSGFNIPAWKFCEEFVPDQSWMSMSEFNSILESLAPTIASHKKLAQLEQEEIDRRNIKQGQAMASRQNPEASLARGIAEGVALALRSLGVTPKEAK
jgi:hypothetical protein